MKKIKPQTIWKAAWIMPWLILLTGIAALVCFRCYLYCGQTEQGTAARLFCLFRGCHMLTMWGGGFVVLAETGILVFGLVLLICRCRLPRAERDRTDLHWRMIVSAPVFAAATLLLMLLVHLLSYGMGV